MAGKFFTYHLLDANGATRFVGVGTDGEWQALWQFRRSARDSELTRWLLTLDEPPKVKLVMSIPVARDLAESNAELERQRLIDAGCELLDARAKDRPKDTYAGGSTKRRKVTAPDGTTYDGVRAASRAVGLTPTGILYRCQNEIDGWHYADNVTKPKPRCALCDQEAMRRVETVLQDGPPFAMGGICPKCNRVLRRLDRRERINSAALREDAVTRRAEFEEKTPKLLGQHFPNSPSWLLKVADLIDAYELLQ